MKLKLFMRSGNQIIITHVENLKIKYAGDEITSLNVTWAKDAPSEGVMIASIALGQIEAIESF